MFMLVKRVSRFENYIDAAMEKFLFQHRLLGIFMIFIGIPLVTLAAVCVCTTMITLPIAFMFGWI